MGIVFSFTWNLLKVTEQTAVMKVDIVLQQCFLLFVTMLSITLVITEPVDLETDVADETPSESEGHFVYVNTNPSRQRRNGLSLLAPPNMYQQKFAPFLHKTPAKRDGFWIWMPAQGYVSVPRQGQAGANGRGGANSNLLRYG
ncbi:uncharacterized protein LOC134723778 [Mytilus trossulus]|uniref:uncharacterized protein LOC134723778 n=1 Tax=Mytilus trossulus TaxID=6551 RepID=UPI0030075C56